MHLNIDMCLYYMTQEELDNFINYKVDNVNIARFKIVCLSSCVGILIGIYFIDNNPTNNVILDIFIYANIFFGTCYSLHKFGCKVDQKLNSF